MADERQSWRKAFDKTGPETLRLQLGRNEISGEYKLEAEKWLLEKDAEAAAIDRKRFQKILLWTIISAVAAIVAAIAGVAGVWVTLRH